MSNKAIRISCRRLTCLVVLISFLMRQIDCQTNICRINKITKYSDNKCDHEIKKEDEEINNEEFWNQIIEKEKC